MSRFLNRPLRFLAKEDFRRHPIGAVYRRCYWRWHWIFRASRPFVVPFFEGMSIRLAPSSASSGIYLNGGFSDRETAVLFLNYLRPGMVAIDCGAHIGEYTLLFASLVGPEGEVHAFEPDPRVFAILQENISRNDLKNVWAHEKALGDAEGEAEFLLAPDATASSLARFAAEGKGERVKVPLTSLDVYVQEMDLKRVDAMKIDVEGSEETVLAGAEWVLAEFEPGLVFLEFERQDSHRLRRRLEGYGYKVSIRKDRYHRFPHIIARKDRTE